MHAVERLYKIRRPGGSPQYVVERAGEFLACQLTAADPFSGYQIGAAVPGGIEGATLLAPVQPSKIVCVGLNYTDHAAEVRKPLPAEPLLFIKPSTAVLDRKSTRLNSSHIPLSRMPSSA